MGTLPSVASSNRGACGAMWVGYPGTPCRAGPRARVSRDAASATGRGAWARGWHRGCTSSGIMMKLGALATAGILMGGAVGVAGATGAAASRMSLVAGDREPADTGKPTDDAIASLRKTVADAPKDREARFALVRGLMRAGELDDALAEAKAWRAIDAYNLVVVRLIGDIDTELGKKDDARRAYSAVVELLPKDAGAQRALASVLKQAGDLQGAYDRLSAAAEMAPTDRRLAFELADVANRMGRADEAHD